MAYLKVIGSICLFGFLLNGCVAKVGNHKFVADGFNEYRGGTPFEVGFSFKKKRHRYGYSDMSLSFFEQRFDLEPNFALLDIDFSWNYYFTRVPTITPFLGTGLGYYKYRSRLIIDTCPAGYICIPGSNEDFQEHFDTVFAKGLNPHVAAGFLLPSWSRKWKLLFEIKHELSKANSGFDFEGTSLMFGVKQVLF